VRGEMALSRSSSTLMWRVTCLCRSRELAGYIAITLLLESDVLVTCVYVLIGARELWLYPWLLYQAFGEAKIEATRAPSSGSGS
jgi:hypothetical protein